MAKLNSSVVEIDTATYIQQLEAMAERDPDLKPHFLNAGFYGQWQTASGKTVIYYSILHAEAVVGVGMAIRYPLPGGLSYFYSPYGPLILDYQENQYVEALQDFFAPFAKRYNAAFIRFDIHGAGVQGWQKPSRAAIATASLQPRNEHVLSIIDQPETLFQNLNKKARYQIRLAERKGAVISFKPVDQDGFKDFYDLLKTTATRNNFGIFSKQYYQAVFNNLGPQDGYLAFAHIDGVPAAVALIVTFYSQAHFVFGASSDDFRKIAPSYLMQWQSILHAKELGCTSYNFGGVTDDIKSTQLHGVTEFKTRFSGVTMSHNLPVDLVLQPVRYKLFTLYKNLQSLLGLRKR